MDASTRSSQPDERLRLDGEERKKAAELIQKNYRGYRTRRQLKGYGLDAETRWVEAIRDARYKQTTVPRAPGQSSPPASKWKTVTAIARHAGAEDSSDASLSDDAADSDLEGHLGRSKDEQAARDESRAIAKKNRRQTAKMMDLQYFLEMVDHKHRHGSNLGKYHKAWQSQNTKEGFFYWLDEGQGKGLSLEECPREKLEREQVRYLSREERLNYLVRIEKPSGRLVWAKNGEPVWTKDELFKDSINGIVPVGDTTREWMPSNRTDVDNDTSSGSASTDEASTEGNPQGDGYANEEVHRAKGLAKLKHVSAGVLLDHMVKQGQKKGRKWIFVADTSFRLYISYKQRGSFQHSSFLHGSRILSAGTIKVNKNGQLRRLSPLSGHYRPPAGNFKAFVKSLQAEGCDMSRVSISQSYAVLVGLEGYVKTRRRIKDTEKAVEHQFDKIVRPEKVKADEEAAQDHSQSAQKEREYLEKQRQRDLGRKQTGKEQSRGLGNGLSKVLDRFTGKIGRNDQNV